MYSDGTFFIKVVYYSNWFYSVLNFAVRQMAFPFLKVLEVIIYTERILFLMFLLNTLSSDIIYFVDSPEKGFQNASGLFFLHIIIKGTFILNFNVIFFGSSSHKSRPSVFYKPVYQTM